MAQYDFGDGPVAGGAATVLFCLWLAWSRFRVVLPLLDKTWPSVAAAIDVALRRAGGAPAYLLPDYVPRHIIGQAQRWDPAEVLRALLAEEVAGRDRSALATRRARAAFPTGKTFDAWDAQLSSVPAPTQAALRTLEWIGRHENLVVCGPSGTGKTFLLEALGQAAVGTGKHVAWFTLEQLGS